MKTLENAHLVRPEFPHEEEAAGMTKEMKSTRDVDVFDEVSEIYFRAGGEAELYAIGFGTADAIFFVRSQKANLCVFTDSNVGKSIASRFGASRKTKHVELRFLHVQELVASGMARIKTVLGTLNPRIYRHLPQIGFEV